MWAYLTRFNCLGFPGGSVVKSPRANAVDPSLIPGSERFPGEGKGNPLQYSYLENPLDRGAWLAIAHGFKKNQTWLSTQELKCILKILTIIYFMLYIFCHNLKKKAIHYFILFLMYDSIYMTWGEMQNYVYISNSVASNSSQPHGQCGPPGSSVHGIIQARILEWAAIPFSRRSSWPRDRTQVSCIAGRFFTIQPPEKEKKDRAKLCPTLAIPWTVACQGSSVHGIL